MTTKMINLIHQTELSTLKAFINICQQLEIPYIATGGTLLGAIRHQGFIPWDDDMDVALLRPDYEKLLKLAPNLLIDQPFFLQTPVSDPNYALSYAKLLNQNTYIEEKNNFNFARKGIFLDIFPLDIIPNSTAQLKKQINDIKIIDSRLFIKLRYNLIETPIRRFKTELTTEQQESASILKKRRKLLFNEYNQQPIDYNTHFKNLASQYNYDQEIFTYQQVTDTIKVPFEDTEITIPADYDAILTQLYGDYMKLPPENHRVAKHISKLIMDNQEFLA